MNILKIRRSDEKTYFEDLVGVSITFKEYKAFFSAWNEQEKMLYLTIDIHNSGLNMVTESVSASLGYDRLINILYYEYETTISYIETMEWSYETKEKARALVQAGFNEIIRSEDGILYTVDNIFPQNFLKTSELNILFEKNVDKMELKSFYNF